MGAANDMHRLLHKTMGSQITLLDEHRMELVYPGWFITILCLIPAILFALAALGIVGLTVSGIADPYLLGSATAALTARQINIYSINSTSA